MAQLSASKRYDVSGQEMWERIGNPGRIYEWHPAIEATEGLDGGKRRVNTLGEGGRVSETILERADRGAPARESRSVGVGAPDSRGRRSARMTRPSGTLLLPPAGA